MSDFQKGDRVRSRKHRCKKGTVKEVFGGPDFPGLSYNKVGVKWDGDRTWTTQFADELTNLTERDE